ATSPPLVANKTAGPFTATATVAGGAQPLAYTLRNLAAAPHTVTAGAATGESASVGSRFPVRLAVTVVDQNGNPVSGAVVTFSAPTHGPSGWFLRSPHRRSRIARVRTDADGVAVAPVLTAGRSRFGDSAELPRAARRRIARIGPVTAVQETGSTSASVYRSPLIPSTSTNGLSVQAASLGLPAAVGATVAAGRYLNAATAR